MVKICTKFIKFKSRDLGDQSPRYRSAIVAECGGSPSTSQDDIGQMHLNDLKFSIAWKVPPVPDHTCESFSCYLTSEANPSSSYSKPLFPKYVTENKLLPRQISKFFENCVTIKSTLEKLKMARQSSKVLTRFSMKSVYWIIRLLTMLVFQYDIHRQVAFGHILDSKSIAMLVYASPPRLLLKSGLVDSAHPDHCY